MHQQTGVFFVCIGVILLMTIIVGGIIAFSITGKASVTRNAQDRWAQVVHQLGGHLFDHNGPLGTPRFKIGSALLLATNLVGVDRSIESLIQPIDPSNEWKTYLVVQATRQTPSFELRWGRHGGGVATGDPGFDATWTLRPLKGTSTAQLFPLFDREVLQALGALAGPTQIYSGGENIHAVRPGVDPNPDSLAALVFVCRRLAGDA